MLQIYTALHCPTYGRTRRLIDSLQRRMPFVSIEVINLDAGSVEVPEYVICTPSYVWDGRVIFLGNPSEEALVKRIDQAGSDHTEPHAA